MVIITMNERIMKLNKMITALNRFISRSSQHVLPFYWLFIKVVQHAYTPIWDKEFTQLNILLFEPLVLLKSMIGKTLFTYVDVSSDEISVVLVREKGTTRNHMYFISKVLVSPITCHQKFEKTILALVIASIKLWCYILAHINQWSRSSSSLTWMGGWLSGQLIFQNLTSLLNRRNPSTQVLACFIA